VKTHVKKYSQVEMLPLETKLSGGKLLPHSDLRVGGVFLEEVSRSRQRKRDIVLGELDQDRDRSWAFVSTVRNLRVPKIRGIS
jgi:hypothetical protein